MHFMSTYFAFLRHRFRFSGMVRWLFVNAH